MLTPTSHTSHVCSAWLCSKTFLAAPCSESGSRGSTIAVAPRSSSQLALQLPSPSSPAVLCSVQGDYNPSPLCPSFTFFPFHVRHDKEMRNQSVLCLCSVLHAGHCTSKGTQYSAHPGCITVSQELCIFMVSIFKVSLVCPDPAFSRIKHTLSAQYS